MAGHLDTDFLESVIQSRYATNLDAVGPRGSTALIMLCSKGKPAAVRALLDRGARIDFEAHEYDDTKSVDQKRRRTALMAAAQHGHADVLLLLMTRGANINLAKSDSGVSLEERKVSGATALHVAAGHSSVEMVETLVSLG
eukprot:gene27615-9107_t